MPEWEQADKATLGGPLLFLPSRAAEIEETIDHRQAGRPMPFTGQFIKDIIGFHPNVH